MRGKGGMLVGLLWLAAGTGHGEIGCEALTGLSLSDIRIDSATAVAEPAPHCKVTGRIGGRIGFSVWLPERWNGRFVMGGSGGFVAPEDNQALRLSRNVLEDGYATASTDTGHRADSGDGAWALNDLEAIVNYGHLGLHRAVLASKDVVRARYGRMADRSYFFGCSNGGREALQEVQRYPEDFDAVIAGAPALDFPGVAAAFVQITAEMFPDPAALDQALVTPSDRARLRAAIEARCDALDGVEDGVLQDPRACDFDPGTLACGNAGEGDCLSAGKVAAIRRVYAGPQGPDGPLHVGFPFGAEATDANGWGSWLTGGRSGGGRVSGGSSVPNAAYAFGVGLMRYFIYHDPAWSYVGYDWGAYEADARPVDAVLSADNPDLSAFRARGGKLLMYHGWADVALSAHMSTGYVDRVYARDPQARDDVRLFMMPGVLHCAGGRGPSQVAFLEALADWHESGEAPDELVAAYPDRPGARKLCAWPHQAVYVDGDPDTVSAYECR